MKELKEGEIWHLKRVNIQMDELLEELQAIHHDENRPITWSSTWLFPRPSEYRTDR